MDDPRAQITLILSRVRTGEEPAASLLPLVYAELRRIANRYMRQERAEHTLEATALVHEAFVRLVDGEAILGSDRTEFLAISAKAMRNLLIDHARKRGAEKRGGHDQGRQTLAGLGEDTNSLSDSELLDLDEALRELEKLDSQQAQVIEMCYFAGMTGQEIAEKLGVHRNTVVRELQMARAWLRNRLSAEDGGSS